MKQLPPEVIERDHELEHDVRKSTTNLAEHRWRYTLGPDGLLYNDDGTPKLDGKGNHKRRSFSAYGRAVGRTSGAIGLMARGYAEWLRYRENDDNLLSIAECVALMQVGADKRPRIIAEARARNLTIDQGNVSFLACQPPVDIHRRCEVAKERDAKHLTTMRELGIPSKLMAPEERREIVLENKAANMAAATKRTPAEIAAHGLVILANALWTHVRENDAPDVIERHLNQMQDELDMLRALVEETVS